MCELLDYQSSSRTVGKHVHGFVNERIIIVWHIKNNRAAGCLRLPHSVQQLHFRTTQSLETPCADGLNTAVWLSSCVEVVDGGERLSSLQGEPSPLQTSPILYTGLYPSQPPNKLFRIKTPAFDKKKGNQQWKETVQQVCTHTYESVCWNCYKAQIDSLVCSSYFYV